MAVKYMTVTLFSSLIIAVLLSTSALAQIHAPARPSVKTIPHTNPYCSNIRSNIIVQGTSKAGETSIAVPRIVLNCIGNIEARLKGFGNDLSFTRMQLQQQIAGNWTMLDQGKNIVFTLDPGIYRLVVVRSNADNNSTRWKLKYSTPSL